ncbi:MAG: Gx transporter family protein [gamma proteobacterium symbiont of Bathyaustriella thionipta]|nr:Gx transporter family protein [gamma proteobacterium symbiont of Bathyaustriella thionipta]MCU7949896.1 Gx transporter family protein [gamma proteobacterium symbiont of Bathyaustriella thionipta]MCU7954070.1 Gx transporter family protein [gamma proteobacterium symbiont of Bathyaustriella thionipta]MCU7956493.1 Gx transporter family protein [gamma proteobacterium symbiont of Bathyaustriella thionipta]MCU7968565.1 Gx transporter family protein [gamma proteobacterium symbiont of Bathyaustriella
MKLHFTTTHQDHRIALLAALAITIHIIESAFPSPLPGVKPGLANVVTLFTFIRYGWHSALQVSLLRVIISSLVLGTFLSPTFLLSLSGALLSLVSLIVIQLPFNQSSFHRHQPSALGYAVIASISHMSGQFLVAWYFFIPHPGLFQLLPIFITFAVILGIVSGIITQLLINQIQQRKL